MKLGISSRKISTTVLISMTDVIFLLLLFLLIASNFSAQTGLPFKLPGSQSREKHTLQVLQIVFFNTEHIEFQGRRYKLETLSPVLKKEVASREQVVRLSAEQSTPLQSLISVMDVIRGAGFERIFVATQPVEQP
ncbi:MAG TPA: biopolymer transporter ExbD [Candidatus Syntrophosphaera sp.]|nr:biopolymer transporter ExbD [Candidatus Syntrophosphaera sp.]